MRRVALGCVIVGLLLLGAACGEDDGPAQVETLPPGRTIQNYADIAATYEPTHDGWLVGVVYEETDSGDSYDSAWKVISSDGVLVRLEPTGYNSYTDLISLMSPGDVISWSPEGDDNKVGGDEVEVLEIGLGEPAPS